MNPMTACRYLHDSFHPWRNTIGLPAGVARLDDMYRRGADCDLGVTEFQDRRLIAVGCPHYTIMTANGPPPAL